MRLRDYPQTAVAAALAGDGLSLDIPPFRYRLQAPPELLAEPLTLLYADYTAALEPEGFYDGRIRMKPRRGLRHLRSPEIEFNLDGEIPFPALPLPQAHPLFEWGLNWCAANWLSTDIVIHAAVVEKDGKALVLPGDPGAGKSTLCAELCFSGWRLLSDELTVISAETLLVRPLPRPISLKERSITIVQERFPGIPMTIPVSDTRKGAIAYAQPPRTALEDRGQRVPVGMVVFPEFKHQGALADTPRPRHESLVALMEHTFNVALIGTAGFNALARICAQARCHRLTYGDTSDARKWLEEQWISLA